MELNGSVFTVSREMCGSDPPGETISSVARAPAVRAVRREDFWQDLQDLVGRIDPKMAVCMVIVFGLVFGFVSRAMFALFGVSE